MEKKYSLLLIILFSFLVLDSFSQSAICSYGYRKRITFDPTKVSGPIDLTNFNALINIASDNDLRVVGSLGHVQNANGFDVIFTADDGVTLLNFQLEKYTSGTGQYTAWVKIPNLSTSINTNIYMYYGNAAIVADQSTPAIVWSNYYGVWHLQTATYTTDNSGNGFTLTDNGTTNQSPAQINDGRADNGTQWLEVSNTFPNITTNFTMSGWIYTTDKTKAGQRVFCDDVNNTGGYALSLGDGGTGQLRFYSRNSTPVILDAGNLINNNTWYYVSAVANITGLTKTIYINGASVASGAFTGAWGTDAGNSSIAGETASGETANRLQGRIDEVHVAKSALSADWLLTEYNNQSSPATFYSITTEPYRWTGGTDTNWGNILNWVGGAVPPSDADIIITNGTFQPTLDASRQIGAMWIQSGATVNLNSSAFILSFRYDITNCGTLTGNTSTVNCNSTTQAQNQYFSGSGTFNLSSLTVNNTFATLPTLTLDKDVSVTGALTLTSGITYTTLVNILNLTNTATSTSGLVTSYVSGPMTKAGTTAFVFPVGKNGFWRRIAIGAPSVSTTFRAEYFRSAYVNTVSLTAPLYNVSTIEYWVLDQAVGLGNALVTLYWENAGTSGITNCADLTVAHWNGASWDEKPGTATGVCAGAGTGSVVTNAVVTTFSPFTFGSKLAAVNPLPIELINFTATPCNKDVCLDWSTATETNNNYFTIEKTKDGSNFSSVGTVNGAGNSTSVLNYSSVDNAPYEGVSYYRLKQTDFNGAFTYSGLQMVDFNASYDFSFNVYPNPNSGDNINIAITSDQGKEVLVVLYDISGKETYSKVIVTANNGDTVYAIDPDHKLAPGIYMITASSQQNIYSKKLIVK